MAVEFGIRTSIQKRGLVGARRRIRSGDVVRLVLLLGLFAWALVGMSRSVFAQENAEAPLWNGTNRGASLESNSPGVTATATAPGVGSESNGGESGNTESFDLPIPEGLFGGPQRWASPEGFSSTIQIMILLTVLSLAPAVLLMTTCFVRIVVVLSLLRHAIGTQQLPPSQVITSLSLFLSILIMAPTWKQVYEGAIVPYTEKQITLDEAWDTGVQPIRRFMSLQIERTDNSEVVHMFLDYLPGASENRPESFDEVPLTILVPAFMLSELKTAFLIGFQIFLPFIIVDMVIASVMVTMGMLMLPPALISLPFKLLLFILVDGWNLVVGMLLDSFQFVV